MNSKSQKLSGPLPGGGAALHDLPGPQASLIPGVLFTLWVAGTGIWLSEWLGSILPGPTRSPISGIMLAILMGLTIGNAGPLPAYLQPGLRFSAKQVLRIGIILLGIRLSFFEVMQVGARGLPVIVACITVALLFTRWLSRRLDVTTRLSLLIAVGTSICGVSAIVATSPAIEAKEEETTYAIATITLFGLLATFLYPYLAHLFFPADPTAAGIFLGTAIHDTAQATGAGLIYSQLFGAPVALDVATVTKLVRNIFIALVVPGLAYLYRSSRSGAPEGGSRARDLFPGFVLGFLLMAFLRTVGDTLALQVGLVGGSLAMGWESLIGTTATLALFCLAAAMAAVGLNTRLAPLFDLGARPLYLGLGAATLVGVTSLVLITAMRAVGIS